MTDQPPAPRTGQHGPTPKIRPDDARGTPPGKGTMPGGHGGRIGNPPHVPTDELRLQVKTLAKVTSKEAIAATIGVSVATLHRHYRAELDDGLNEAVATVGAKLLGKALEGNLTAMIFFLKTRGKGAYSQRIEHTGADGGPLRHVDLSGFLAGKSDDELAALLPLLEQLAAAAGTGDESGGDIVGAGAAAAGTGEAGEGEG